MLNNVEMLVFVWILKIAYAKIGAKENLFILPSDNSSSPSFGGIEFVTITWSNCDFRIFSKAFPENNPWVANDETDKAPCSFKTRLASHSVPAVSIISSIIIAFLPYTLPTMCMLPIFPAPALCFMIIAKLVSLTPTDAIKFWKFFALVTPPASGDITTTSFKGVLFCSTK